MPNRLLLAAFTLLAVSACSDGPMGNAPIVPPPTHGTPLGMIRGTVNGTKMTAEFVPMGANAAVGKNSAISPAIYGGTTTIAVTGEFVSLTNNVPVPGLRTWIFNVHMQNLLAFPIGSNYSASNANPVDTSGVFIGFTTLPMVTAVPGCPGLGCTVNVGNWAGKQAFNSLGQEFFWYKDRPTAFQGTPGTDTTRNQPWQFIGTFDPPSGDTAHTFTFALMVSAAWPSPNDTAWAYSYDGAVDSLPDQFAKPRWKTPFAQINGFTTLGSETFNMGTDLVLTAGAATSSIYIARNDSMVISKSASVVLRGTVLNIAGAPLQGLFALVEPGPTGKQAVVGIYQDHVAFEHLDPVTGAWSDIVGTALPVDATVPHTYRIGKFGAAELFLLCVDNSTLTFLAGTSLDARAPDFNTTSVFFGAVGNATAAANFHVTNMAYVLGAFNGGC